MIIDSESVLKDFVDVEVNGVIRPISDKENIWVFNEEPSSLTIYLRSEKRCKYVRLENFNKIDCSGYTQKVEIKGRKKKLYMILSGCMEVRKFKEFGKCPR
jgi:hypothetical protein